MTATVIDDSYSSNTDGFALALGLLKSFPSSRKKVLLTRGMIELGNMHTPIHERIGHEIALSADEVIIITPDAAEAITRGIREKNNATVIENIYDPKAIVDRVKKYRDTSTVLLIENRIPAPLKQELAPYHAKT
jgi:UDP-N-acetylmuramoyl-tripeptide--D-alanyl-D-alanine ligase